MSAEVLHLPRFRRTAATGLSYYGYRWYEPVNGRWPSRDPIQEMDGNNLYAFVKNYSTAKWDLLGLYTLNDAKKSLEKQGIAMQGSAEVPIISIGGTMGAAVVPGQYQTNYFYTDTQVFDEWLRLEKNDAGWLNDIPECPDRVIYCPHDKKPINCDNGDWGELKNDRFVKEYHPGADYCMRSKAFGLSAQQCCYELSDDKLWLNLIKSGEPAGSPDRVAAAGISGSIWNYLADAGHIGHDVTPFNLAKRLNRLNEYLTDGVRPPSQGGGSCYAK